MRSDKNCIHTDKKFVVRLDTRSLEQGEMELIEINEMTKVFIDIIEEPVNKTNDFDLKNHASPSFNAFFQARDYMMKRKTLSQEF